jgi:hypothetical protein
MPVTDMPIIYNYMARYITLTERLNKTFNPDGTLKIDEGSMSKNITIMHNGKEITRKEVYFLVNDPKKRLYIWIDGEKVFIEGKEIIDKEKSDDLTPKEKFEKRQKERDEHWKKLEDDANPQEKVDIRKKKNIVDKLFNIENSEHNDNKFKDYGLKDEDILNIEQGGFDYRGEIKSGTYKGYQHCHINKTGSKKGTDNLFVYMKNDGKIEKIGTHKELGIDRDGRNRR